MPYLVDGAGTPVDNAEFVDDTGSDTITFKVNLPRHVVKGGTVVATLYYQSIPPAYLQDRFTTVQGKDTRRLHYLTSHLNQAGTHIEKWKLLVDSQRRSIGS